MDVIYRVLGEEEYLKNLYYVGIYLIWQCNFISSLILACSNKYCLCISWNNQFSISHSSKKTSTCLNSAWLKICTVEHCFQANLQLASASYYCIYSEEG